MKYGLCLAALLWTGTVSAQNWEQSIVQIEASKVAPDFDSPWRKGNTSERNFLGVVVGPQRILVSSQAVAYASFIQMNRIGEANKYPLKTIFVDHAASLAILAPEQPEALQGFRPVSVGGDLKVGDQAVIHSGTKSERLSPILGRVRDVNIRRVPMVPFTQVQYILEVRANSGLGWSEPVIVNNQLVGMVIAANNLGAYVLPSRVIKHFMQDHLDENYRGFVRLSLNVGQVISPVARNFLKIGNARQGVLVTQVMNGSPFGDKVQNHDLITKIGNYAINERGFIRHAVWGPVHFTAALKDYYAGDEVRLTIVRDNKEQVVSSKISRYTPDEDMISEIPDDPYAHLIVGGLLFQELSQAFLTSWGEEWDQSAPDVFLYLHSLQEPSDGGKKRVIILNRVMADDVNKGYQRLNNIILEKANGVEVHNLDELETALKTPVVRNGERYAVFEFSHANGIVIIPYENINQAHARIAKNYNIQTTAHFANLN